MTYPHVSGRRATLLQAAVGIVNVNQLEEALHGADSEFQLALAEGRALVDEASGHADETRALVGQAGGILDTVEGTGADVVAKHTEVLTLHGEAIGAAADAANDAALAAGKALEASDHAANALVAYEAQQAQVDAEQTARLELQGQLIESVRQAQVTGLHRKSDTIIKSSSASRSDEFVSAGTGTTGNIAVTALGSWTGKIITEMASSFAGDGSRRTSKGELQVPDGSGGRTYTVPVGSGGSLTYLQLTYYVDPGTQQVRDLAGGGFDVIDEVWTTVPAHTWTVPAGASQIAISFQSGWERSTYSSWHGLRVVANGVPIATWGPRRHLGPLIGSSYRSGVISKSNLSIAPGTVIEFQVWSGSSVDAARWVEDTGTKLSWLVGA